MKKKGQKGALNEPTECLIRASNVDVGLIEVQRRRDPPRLDNLLAPNESERGPA